MVQLLDPMCDEDEPGAVLALFECTSGRLRTRSDSGEEATADRSGHAQVSEPKCAEKEPEDENWLYSTSVLVP
jgi:hypothetical protein